MTIDHAVNNHESLSHSTASSNTLTLKEDNLVWIDMEMTGLSPESDRILEIAVIVTDSQLEKIVEGPVIAIHQSDARLDAMDDWNTKTHARTGLTPRVRQSLITEKEAEIQIKNFLQPYIYKGKPPMCGNSIGQDRRFMEQYMPDLSSYFHYRNIDVSTLKELCRRWCPELMKKFKKKNVHSALADIQESIEELKFYRQHFLIAQASQSTRLDPLPETNR